MVRFPKILAGTATVGLLVSLLATGCQISPGSGAPPASIGTVSGVLNETGGPPPGVNQPVGGEIQLTGSARTFSTTAGKSGNFSLAVPPGTYTVQGRPDGWGGSGFPCTGQSVVVTAGQSVTTTVSCAAIP